MEDFYLRMASERIFPPLIRKHRKSSTALPAEGIFHNLVIIAIDKRYRARAQIMSAVWGLGQLMFSKTVIIVDRT